MTKEEYIKQIQEHISAISSIEKEYIETAPFKTGDVVEYKESGDKLLKGQIYFVSAHKSGMFTYFVNNLKKDGSIGKIKSRIYYPERMRKV